MAPLLSYPHSAKRHVGESRSLLFRSLLCLISVGPFVEPGMPKRTKPPFRADHVGSLLRPQHLLDARDKFDKGEISATQLRSVEDDAIRQMVKRQEEIGVRKSRPMANFVVAAGTWILSVASAA